MPAPLPVPDEALLRRYLLGELSGQELESVAAYLDRHPEVASTLDGLKANDTLLAALKAGDARADSPQIAELIAKLAKLPPKSDANSTDSPEATGDETITARRQSPSAFETADPDTHSESEGDIREMLSRSEHPGDLGRLGRYRVLRILGRGGMGVVFEAEDDKLKRRVALKAMLPALAANTSARKRFIREAETAAKVEHDNIVPIYDIADANGVPFLAMPLLVGEPLDTPLKPGNPLPLAHVLAIGGQIAEGLAAAHAAGLIHRDIKPSNVWLERTASGTFKRVRILDFGLARSLRDGAGLTHSGAVMGTPAYMAPEQARGQAVDHRADLFSLGCVLYQMTTGRRPFRGDDTLAVLTALANDTPPAPIKVNPAVPPALSTLIERLLSKRVEERWPPTAQEVADELAGIALPQAVIAIPVAPIAPRAEEVWSSVTTPTIPADEVPLATSAESGASARRRGGFGPVYLAVAVLLCALGLVSALYGGTVIRIATNKGELVIEVDDPNIEVKVVRGDAVLVDRTKGREFVLKAGDGEVIFFDPVTEVTTVAKKFEMKRGDKVRVSATMGELAAARPKPKPGLTDPRGPLPSDPDRKAAEALHGFTHLGLGLTSGKWVEIKPSEPLPSESFVITSVAWNPGSVAGAIQAGRLNPEATASAYLPHLASLRSLEAISDSNALLDMTDDQLIQLATSPVAEKLTGLAAGFELSPATFETIKRFPKLRYLGCRGSLADDKVLRQLGSLNSITNLELVKLGKSKLVTPQGLAALTELPLSTFNLSSDTVVTRDFAHRLTTMPHLTRLSLVDSNLNDEVVKELAKCPKLEVLGLGAENVTDAALEHIKGIRTLNELSFFWSKVTKPSVDKLAATRPDLNIDWNGTTIKSTTAGKPVDLLALVDAKRDRVAGRWKLADGALVGGGTTFVELGFDSLQVPYAPSAEYDLVTVVQRTGVDNAGPNTVCRFALTLTGPFRCQACFDTPLDNKVMNGLQLIDGKTVVANETRTYGDFFGKDGTTVVITCRVRKDGVSVLTDGQERFKWKGDPGKLGHDDSLWKYPDKTRLAVAVQNAEYRISEWRVYPVAPSSGPTPAPLTAEQRKAVEWVLSVGGKVNLVGSQEWISDAKQLVGPFTLASVNLGGIKSIDDRAIDRLRDLPPITFLLSLSKTAITDAGLAKLVTFPNLKDLIAIDVSSTEITRAGLTHLKKLPRLTSLNLIGLTWIDGKVLAQITVDFPLLDRIFLNECNKVGDAEMDLFSGNKNILTLGLAGTSLTNAGIKKLERLTQLQVLTVNWEGVTDTALDTIVKFQELWELGVGNGVTDAGLVKLASLPKLNILWLSHNAGVTDAGLVHVAKCKGLTILYVKETKVTKAGVEKLAMALPNCRIEYTGGVIEPKASPTAVEAMPADNAFPGEVVLREPFDRVPQEVATVNGKEATTQSVNGVLEVRWPVGNRRPFNTFQYTFGSAVPNPAFALRMRPQGVDYTLSFHSTGDDNGWSRLGLRVRPDGTWSLFRTGARKNGEKWEADQTATLKESAAPHPELTSGKWVALTVRSSGAATEVRVNGQLLTSVTEPRAPEGMPFARHGAVVLSVSVPERAECGFDLDYLVVWKLPTSDAERKCAEWVMAGGGRVTIRVGGKEAALTKPELLAGGPFRIVAITWQGSQRAVTDADLDYFAPLTDLTRLVLGRTEITDDGLKRLAGFAAAAKLARLGFDSSRVTDAGLAHLKGLPLQSLTLKGCDRLTADGFATMAQIKTLRGLLLDGSSIDGAGLAALKPLADLDELGIGQTKVTATGFAHLAAFKKLITLNLQELPLTDDGLDVLAGLPQLRNLNLTGTKVTKAGVEKLAAKLPGCKIVYDGGTIMPK